LPCRKKTHVGHLSRYYLLTLHEPHFQDMHKAGKQVQPWPWTRNSSP